MGFCRSAFVALFASSAVLLAGCGAGVSPTSGSSNHPTEPTSAPQISISPAALTFASQTVGTTSAAQTVTVSNVGNATLTFSNSAALGDTTDFSLVSTCGNSLAAGGSCTLTVTFHPATSATPIASSITLTDNSGNANNAQQTITLAGTGSTVPTPVISISPTSLNFADTTVGATSAAQTVTISNTGNAALTIGDITLGDTQDYSMTSTCGTTLAANASCTLTVSFHPASTGSVPATIIVTDNSGNVVNAQQTIALTGNGLSSGVPIATLMPTALTFPDTAAGTTSAAMSFQITNTGTAPLAASGVLSGAAFAHTGEVCSSGTIAALPAGAYCTETFTFTPAAASTAYSGTYTFTDNSNGLAGSTQVVTLSGNGLPAATNVTLTPTTLNFADTTVGQTSPVVVATLTNGGTTTLTGISPAITGGATATAFAISSTTCGTTLAASSSCTISVTFKPFATGSYLAYLTVTDSAGSQVSNLTGNGVQATLTLSTTAISFPTTTVGTTTQAYSSTLTNTGGATANLTGITYSGSSVFATSNTCGSTLAGGASCTISATFTPAAAIAYTGTITITSSNATPSSLTIALSGSGTTSTVSYNLYELPDPGSGPGSGTMAALYALVDNAQKTIDMTMYALQDTTFSGKLVNACKRGVVVRVVLDQNSEKSADTPAYNQLNAQANCSAVWANKAFNVTHEKSFIVDGTTMALMSLNLQSQYYTTTRDYAMIYNDPVDIAAVEATFAMDYAAGTPASGVAGASDFSYQPGPGNDLIWSPTTAKQKMLDIINNATTTLQIENEELASSASYIVSAIAAKCTAGLTVKVLIEDESSTYNTQMTTLKNAGCSVHYYYSSSGFYVHAKDVVADYGLPTQAAYMGSINYSNASMTLNRELGMNISDQASVALLYNTFVTDFNAAYVF